MASAPGQSFGLAVFVDHVISGTGLGRVGFSGVYALATLASAAVVLAGGRAIDTFGRRLVWLAAALGVALSCLLLSVVASALGALVALAVLRSSGQGLFPLLATVTVASGFERHRGKAQAVATQGLTLAGVAFPAVAAGLIGAVGWRGALQVIAAAVVLVIAPLALLAGAGRGSTPPRSGPPRGVRSAVRRPGVPVLLFVLGIPPLVTTGVVVHAGAIAAGTGAGLAVVAAALGVKAACTAGGSLLGGLLADRCAPRVVLSALAAAVAGGCVLVALGGRVTLFAGFAVLGVAGGLYATANGTLWARVYGLRSLGGLQGLAYSMQIVGAALGPLPLGLALSTGAGAPLGLAVFAALALAGLVLGLRWRPRPSWRDDGGPAPAG